MGLFKSRSTEPGAAEMWQAISRSQAIIEFSPDGRIVDANANFLATMGYTIEEIRGQHHRLFVPPAEAASPDYATFWKQLNEGQFQAREFRRIGKGGVEVWIQASYNPVLDRSGKVARVVKVAADITAEKLKSADAAGQLAAISKSQAVIEFTLEGEILTANENFCRALGYRLEEIKGKHHRIFVEPGYASSDEYRDFWARLGRGEFQAAEYLRLGKGGREVWIQASYNPILDMNGRPFKVVKYATDITATKAATKAIGAGLAQISEGDLTVRLDSAFPGEFEEVRHAFNRSVERFSDIVERLRETSAALRTATGEILSGANDLAERTTKQAAAIEETSAAMEQLSGTVVENTRRAEAANAKSQAVSHAAEQAGSVMQQSNDAMERISNSSSKISNIIGMIDDIAFQTNLLALNASVEAARAGEAGKGFAVVAVEVRRLAQSAAEASAEVKTLIEQSGQEVAAGGRLVAEASQTLVEVLGGIKESASLIESITSAAREQAGSIAEVSTAIRQMDEMTQHNAALVEQTNAAIEQTEGQATELDTIVEIFVTGRRSSADSLTAAPARRSAPVHRSQGNAAIAEDWQSF